MIGRNHIIAGLSSLACIGIGVDVAARQTDGLLGEYIGPSAANFRDSVLTLGGLPAPAVACIGVALFVFGTLLPDIDNEKSLLGRHVHIPVEHRTWTHALWFVLASAMASTAVPLLWWFTAGYAVHLFWDSLSRGGVCWFYPLSNYRRFGGGAKVKNGHVLRLYGVGDGSETVVVAAAVFVAALLAYWYALKVLGLPLPTPLIV